MGGPQSKMPGRSKCSISLLFRLVHSCDMPWEPPCWRPVQHQHVSKIFISKFGVFSVSAQDIKFVKYINTKDSTVFPPCWILVTSCKLQNHIFALLFLCTLLWLYTVMCIIKWNLPCKCLLFSHIRWNSGEYYQQVAKIKWQSGEFPNFDTLQPHLWQILAAPRVFCLRIPEPRQLFCAVGELASHHYTEHKESRSRKGSHWMFIASLPLQFILVLNESVINFTDTN